MADIASLGIAVDTTQVVQGTKALDALGSSSAAVEQRVASLNGQMNDTAKIMRTQAEAASASSAASQQFIEKLQREIDLYGANRSEIERSNAAVAGLSKTTQELAAALGTKIDAMQRDEKAARDAAAAEDQAAKAGDNFLRSLQDQISTLGMNTSQLQSLRAAQLGVTDAASSLITQLSAKTEALKQSEKAEREAAAAEDAATKAAATFMKGLQDQLATLGMSTSQLQAYRAAKLGVSDAAGPLIKQIATETEALKASERAAKEEAAAKAAAAAAGDRFVKSLQDQAATLGMSRSQLLAYQAAQLGVTDAAAKSIAVIKAQEDALRAAAKAKEDAARSAFGLADAIKVLAASWAVLKTAEYIKEAALMAARYETLGVVMEVVGRNAGYTKTQIDSASQGIARQGITMIEARESAVKLVQAHVDLQHAEGLARIAQNAAVIGHMNSSEAFDRLVNGIARGNVLILRNIGINVNLQSAYRQMADELGKTTKELTENERVEARRIAVFERGADINGVYEKSMDTAGKQITSMTRYTQDFKTMFGETFNEALTIGVMGLTDHLKGSNKAITDLSKNDQLEEWGHNITRVFVAIANTISNAMTAMQKVNAFAQHMDNRTKIGLDADSDVADNIRNSKLTTLSGVNTFYQNGKRIDSVRQAALAEENARYEAEQGALSANFGKFERAAEVREATRTAKRKAEADEKLKVDQDYVAKSQALLTANANKSVEIQQAAQMKLYKEVYVGTPQYRDTEGREPKEKVDQAENTRLADALKRMDTLAARSKAETEYLMKLDEMRFKAGELGETEYYENRKTYADLITGAEIESYNNQIAELRKHYNNTEGEGAKNAKAIHDIEDKIAAARQKFGFEYLTRDEEERLRKAGVVKASDEAANKYIEGLNAQMTAIEAANGKRAQSASSIADETAAQLRAAAALMSVQAAGPDGNGHTQADADAAAAMLITLNQQADAQERIAAALRSGEAANASRKLADQAIQDWKNVGQSIGESLSEAFGTAGKAAGGMFKAYADNASRQLQINKEIALTRKLADGDPEKVRNLDKLQRDSASAQLRSYGEMAGAAQGFFQEGSKGYQAMHAASMVLYGAEVALSLVKGVNAVLTQGGGDPYSAFGRMAAMAAIVAGLGVAISGGGGSGGEQSAAEVQKAQGTGSVFGNSDAKSNSIARGIELSAANSNIQLNYTAGMLAALKSIDASMSGLANLVVGAAGVTDGSNLGIQTGQLNIGKPTDAISKVMTGVTNAILGPGLGGAVSSFINNLWGKTTQNIVDSGLQLGGKVSDLQSGKGFQQYASVDTTKSSWFGLSKNTSNSVKTAGLDDGLASQFGLIFQDLETAIDTAAGGLGVREEEVTKALASLVIAPTKVSLKDLKGDDLTAAINGVISKTMDDMAAAAFPGLDRFRKVGEGYAETVMRLATDSAKLDGILGGIGMTFGTTGIASLDARENLIKLAGGIDELASQTSGFATNFLSKAEQLAPVQKYVADQLAGMGLASIKTRDDFKNVVLGLDLTQVGAQGTYATLMELQEAFAKTHAATVDLSKTEQEIADERKDLQSQLDELTMSSAQLLKKQRDALDASNQGLFDQIQVATKAKKAHDDAKASLTTFLGTMTTFANSVKGFNSSLVMGSLSTLTPEQQYAEARRQFETTRDKAATGDSTAQGQLQAMENAFLTISQKINGSDSQYSSDLAGVMKANDQLAAWSAGQVDVAQASLDALNDQVDGIAQLNATMLTVAQNMQYLPTLTGNVSTPVFATPASIAVDFSAYGTAITAPLIAEIKSMREEIIGLRADAVKQTGDLINTNVTVTLQAAETVVDGVHDAVTDGAYASTASIRKVQ